MKTPVYRRIRIFIPLAAAFVFFGCEYLFYSPAFMPAVSETKLMVIDTGDYAEFYNDEQSAYGTWIYTGAGNPLEISSPNTTGTDVPALESLAIGNEYWHGVSEFLGIFFEPASSVQIDGGSNSGTGLFHGYSVPYTYTSYTVSSYDLPVPAPQGINEDDRTTRLSGNLAVVEISADGPEDELSGRGTFVFGNGPDNWGLLYMIFYHDSGQATMAYQKSVSGSSESSYFSTGRYTYSINVFLD